MLSGVCTVCDENIEVGGPNWWQKEGRESRWGEKVIQKVKIDGSRRETEFENTVRDGDPEASSSELSVNRCALEAGLGGGPDRDLPWRTSSWRTGDDEHCWKVIGYTMKSIKSLAWSKQCWVSELKWRPQGWRRGTGRRFIRKMGCHGVDRPPAEF